MPRTLIYLKATAIAAVNGRGATVSGGVYDHGTQEEDGPVTWEVHVSPREYPVKRRAGDFCLRNATRQHARASQVVRRQE